MKNQNKRKYLIVFLLSFSTLCYNLPYLSGTFYTQFLEAFNLSNQQAGALLTMFSLTATPGYLFGGILADKFSPKKLVVVSQLMTAALGFTMTFLPNYSMLLVCYLGFGISTTFIHWGAFMKLVRAQADENEEGRIFGFFEMCASIVGAVASYGILAALTKLAETVGFRFVTSVFGVVLVAVAILIALLVKDARGIETNDNFKFSMVGKALKHPVTWINGLIVMGLFAITSAATYLNPYLSGVFGTSVAFSTAFAIANKTFVRLLLSPVGGIMLDKYKTPKFLIMISIAISVVSMAFIMIPQQPAAVVIAIFLAFLLIGCLALSRSGFYTPIPEAKVPYDITGTAIGIASAVGYSTDLWLYNLCGKWLDTYGNDGYRNIFLLILVALALIVVCSMLLKRYELKHVNQAVEEMAA